MKLEINTDKLNFVDYLDLITNIDMVDLEDKTSIELKKEFLLRTSVYLNSSDKDTDKLISKHIKKIFKLS